MQRLLLLVAGAKGAIGSTLAVVCAAHKLDSDRLTRYLTTSNSFPEVFGVDFDLQFAGWDTIEESLEAAVERHGIVPSSPRADVTALLRKMVVMPAPSPSMAVERQQCSIEQDIDATVSRFPGYMPVCIDVLPAAAPTRPTAKDSNVEGTSTPPALPDIAYSRAAVSRGVGFVNFTPNYVETEELLETYRGARVPICGRDGKTGQTYFKTVIASALRARALRVDGWFSTNILGNQDGANLSNPNVAADKIANKTAVLDDVLGYSLGNDDAPSHRVCIDYYPPRGDAKEAWDVIDFCGLFDLPMSLRINLQARDSVLAASLLVDLARWMEALQRRGCGGPIPRLGFYFKRPVGPRPPATFWEQWSALGELASGLNGGLVADQPPIRKSEINQD